MNYKTQKIINKLTFGLTEMGAGLTLSDIWYNLKFGFRNLRKFFWVVWKHRPWDFRYNLNLLGRGVEIYLKDSQNSYAMEVDETRLPKEENMKRVIEIINNLDKDDYITKAEEELGKLPSWGMKFKSLKEEGKPDLFEMIDERTDEEKAHSMKVYERSDEIEQDEWSELWDILEKDAQGWWN